MYTVEEKEEKVNKILILRAIPTDSCACVRKTTRDGGMDVSWWCYSSRGRGVMQTQTQTQTDLRSYPRYYGRYMLRRHWRALGLPAEAAGWMDFKIEENFRKQQSKVWAFASALHSRLGAGSIV